MDLLTWMLIGMMISSVILSWYCAITHNIYKKKNYELRALNSYNLNQFKNKELNINSSIDSEIETELDMFREVSETIKKRLTPALFDKLCLYYNKSELGNIIIHKAYFAVVQFVMYRNNKLQVDI